MADRFPLILNTSANQIQEIGSGDTLDLTGNSIKNVGVLTATSLDISGDIDVDGHTNLDNVSISGVTTGTTINATTFVGNGDFVELDVDGHTNLDNVSIAGLSTHSEGIFIPDSKELKIGQTAATPDLKIYSDGSNGYIREQGPGSLYLQGINLVLENTSGSNYFAGVSGAEAIIYYNGNPKFTTTNTGINITGSVVSDGLVVDGNSDLNGDLDVDGHTNLDNVNVAGVTTFTGAINGSSAAFTGNVSIGGTLTYEDVTNIDSVGIVTAREGVFIPDNKELKIGNSAASPDLKIYHDTSDSVIHQDGTGDLRIRSDNSIEFNTNGTQNAIWCDSGAAVKLYYNNGLKLKTTDTGIDVTGQVVADSASFTDDGSSSPTVKIFTDDANPYALNIGNSSYNASSPFGLNFFNNNSGEGYFRHIGNGAYLDYHFSLHNNSTNKLCLKFEADDQSVELYAEGNKKLETKSTGIELHNGCLDLNRQSVLHSGAIYFDSPTDTNHMLWHDYYGHPNLSRTTTGNFDGIKWNCYAGLQLFRGNEAENIAKFLGQGACELYHNNVLSLTTTTTGIEIKKTGSGVTSRLQIEATNGGQAGIELRTSLSGTNRAARIDMYNQNTLQWSIFNDYQQDGTNDFSVRHGAEEAIRALPDGAVELYHDDNLKLSTSSSGATITGQLNSTDSVKVNGASNGGQTVVISSGSTRGSTIGVTNSSAAGIFWSTGNGYGIYKTAGAWSGNYQQLTLEWITGIHLNGGDAYGLSGVRFTGSAYPTADNQYDLGTSSLRWRNIYTNDLNLSNEGGANEVDGTWGNYTIQEGESDLFLINNRSGKKYKFNLTEVS